MLRVAIFTDTYVPELNGAAKTLEHWTNYLASRNIPFKVFAPNIKKTDGSANVERYPGLPFPLYPDCQFTFVNPVAAEKALREFRPTIIHLATQFNLGYVGRRLARKLGVPLVASYHTHFDQYLTYYKLGWMEPIVNKYMAWFYSPCQKVYVPSPSAAQHLHKLRFSNMEIWGRGIFADRFHPNVDREQVLRRWGIDSNKFIVLYVGRLAREKSIDVLLESFRRVPEEQRGSMELVIAGDGPLHRTVINAAAGNANIKPLGFVTGAHIQQLYAAADVVLFPSATETFGNVVLESLACGTPVIGAAAGGVMDNVEHGVTGLLCPPRDVEAFKQALLTVYHDPDLRLRLGEAGRKYAVSQSWDVIFDRLLQSYQELH